MSHIDLSFIVINWNSGKYLKKCIPTLFNQKNINIEVILVDNNSHDNSKEIIDDLPYNIKTVYNTQNNGYSGAANQGIKLSKGDYVSVINPDIILTDTYGIEIISVLNKKIEASSASGKLIKFDFENNSSLNALDSTGIVRERLKFFDRGQNSSDLKRFDSDLEVFGVCGAAPIYKKKALEDIKILDEYFDEDFFAYKEDIDLSWRLNSNGWTAVYVPNALAYHGRGFGSPVQSGIKGLIASRNNQSDFVKRLSFRNHYYLLIKNLKLNTLNNQTCSILVDELKRIGFCLIFEPKTIIGIIDVIKKLPKMLKKRSLINKSLKKG